MQTVKGWGMITGHEGIVGAVLASAIVAGAVVFHLSPWSGTRVAMSAGAEPSYALFTMALMFLALALVNLYLNRNTVPFVGRLSD